MYKPDILMYLLVVFVGLVVHACFLWKDYFADRLRLELTLLYGELAKLTEILTAAERASLSQFSRLLLRASVNAGSLNFWRLFLSRMLLSTDRKAELRRQSADLFADVKPPSVQLQAIEIYCRFEDAIALRIMTGSPTFWLVFAVQSCYSAIRPTPADLARTRPSHWVRGIELASATLPE